MGDNAFFVWMFALVITAIVLFSDEPDLVDLWRGKIIGSVMSEACDD